nr:imaginal morphogenesis protein-Late 2 [Sclerodermus guani]
MRPFVAALNLFLVVIAVSVTSASPLALLELLSYSNSGPIAENGLEESADVSKVPAGKVKFRQTWVNIKTAPENEVRVQAGQKVELECLVEGSPPPQVYWLRGTDPKKKLDELLSKSVSSTVEEKAEYPIASTSSKLVIECASTVDAGLIHCAAVAGNAKVISAPTDLSVDENAENSCSTQLKPIIVANIPSIFGLIGQRLVLPCRAVGKPRPTTSWKYADGKALPSNDSRIKVLDNGDLLIDPLKWEDMNMYKCLATNSDGTNFKETFLYPMTPSQKN